MGEKAAVISCYYVIAELDFYGESNIGITLKIFLLKYFMYHVLSFVFALTVPGSYRLASHNTRFTLYGNAFNVQYWFLKANSYFVDETM